VADESTTPEVKWEVEPELHSEVAAASLGLFDEHVNLDLTGHHPDPNGVPTPEPPEPAATSDRGTQLESDHWRERAVLWRERALAAELVVKMLQRNLDDLRANVEDLRVEQRELAKRQELESASHRAASEMSPWRRFVNDMSDKYLR
jgi:hypothetical protein